MGKMAEAKKEEAVFLTETDAAAASSDHMGKKKSGLLKVERRC